MERGVLHTTDGGRTWHRIAVPVYSVTQITFSDALQGWMLANRNTAEGEQAVDIFRTTDGGQTWSKVSNPSQPVALPAAFAHNPALAEVGRLPTLLPSQAGVLPVSVVSRATGDTAFTVVYMTGIGGVTWSPTTPVQA